MRSVTALSATLLLLSLAACDSGGPGPDTCPDPANPACGGPVDGTVTEYLTGLPSWDAFAPDVPEQQATPTGPPVAEAPVTMDVTTLDDEGNEVISEDVTYSCTSTPYTLAETPEKIVIYDPDRSILYPGAFVQGKSYVVGSVDALTIPERAPLRISIPDVASTTGDNFRTVQPNQAEVSNAIGNIVGNAVLDNLDTPSAIEFKMETYHSESQFALEARLSGRYLGFSGSAGADVDRNASETTVAVQFTQRMYTVAVERPASDPASFFSQDFTPAKLEALRNRGQIGPDNLPVYVSEVVYGRMMMFTLTSTESESDIRATLQAAYQGIGGSVEGSLDVRQRNLLQQSKITVTSYGGDAEATLATIKSGNWADYFTEDAPLSSASPLSYTFRNLGDNSIAAVTEATDYSVRTCDARQATPGTFDLLDAQTLALPFAPNATGRLVADVNGDGVDDLVFNRLDASGNQIAVAIGDGNGGFSLGAAQTHPEAPSGGWGSFVSVSIHVGDVNGDGRDDLVWSGVTPDLQHSYVAVSTGSGFDFRPEQTQPGRGFERYLISALADIDGDGKDDLIRGTRNNQLRFWTFFGTDDGSFDYANASGQTLSQNPGFPSYTFVPMDFTGDGRTDMVMNQLNAERNVLHHAPAKATRDQAAPFHSLLPPRDFGQSGWDDYVRVVGQFNGVAGEDLVFVRRDGNAIHRAYSTGSTFSLSSASNFQNPGLGLGDRTVDAVVAANVNGDAFTDLVVNVLVGTVNRSYVLLGQSEGHFDTTTRVSQTHPVTAVAWGGYVPLAGRFNGDARDDIVWLSTASDNRVYVGLSRE